MTDFIVSIHRRITDAYSGFANDGEYTGNYKQCQKCTNFNFNKFLSVSSQLPQ